MQASALNTFIIVCVGSIIGATQLPVIVADNWCQGQPEGTACWQELDNPPECYVWTSAFRAVRSLTWTGKCDGTLAQSAGELRWERMPPSGTESRGLEAGVWDRSWTQNARTLG